MKGLIAFFDILGYQSFLENNSATESALEVLDLITEIPLETKKEAGDWWIGQVGDATDVSNIVNSLKHLIFSDTIVLTIPYPKKDTEKFRHLAVGFLAAMATRLTTVMFSKGLPLRGVMHEGDYLIKDACFAGTGFVEAYRMCSKLDFSGLVLSPQLTAYILKKQKKNPIFTTENFDSFFVSILTPLKGGQEAHLTHTSWPTYLSPAERIALRADIIQSVMHTFWSHKKDCGIEVDSKVRNTCKMIRRLLMASDVYDAKKAARPSQKGSSSASGKT